MSAGIKKVVEIVAPIALNALIDAAEALIAGPVFADKRKAQKISAAASDPERMVSDLSTYVTTNFATSYGYYFSGLQSLPPGSPAVLAASTDIVVWDPTTGVSSINTYLQTILAGSIPPSDSINIGKNLSDIFTERFKEESLEWTPLMKRYNQPDKLRVDSYMVTSAAVDANNQRCGIAAYCFVAYNLS